MKATAKMIAEQQNDHRLRAAMDRLLRKLRHFMRAYPMRMDDEMPEHELVWADEIGRGGPALTILDAIKSHPVLWCDALPPEVCVVPRTTLAALGLSPDAISYAAGMGEHMCEVHAARYEHALKANQRGKT